MYVREYLAVLLENGLIQYEAMQTYRTTEKGFCRYRAHWMK
ncbi:MAG: hypothetical protein WAM14_06545 [Candidatus Nitrosopolaris sp.]